MIISIKFNKYKHMDKLELMEEMIEFQEFRQRKGTLTPSMMIEGIAIFTELNNKAETPELKLITTSYIKHLQYELNKVA